MKNGRLNQKTVPLGLTVLFLFLSTFAELTPLAQGAPTATLWIKIHRIQAIDPIDEDGADWRYSIWVYTGQIWGKLWIVENYTASLNHDDIILDVTHRFDNITLTTTTVNIDLLEDDPPYYNTADISSSVPEPGVSGKRFKFTYNLTSNTIGGRDKVTFEGGYYKTSGEYDGRVAPDEYDANLWFMIWDNLGPNHLTYFPTSPTVGEDVQFTDMYPYPEGKITSWLWNFGDGCTSTDRNPIHKYEKAKTYTVSLTVTDDKGATSIMSQPITIRGNPFYVPPWFSVALVLIAIALIVGVGVVIVKRRKRQINQRKLALNKSRKFCEG